MGKIFVDANAYLQFYVEQGAQRRALLTTLVEIREHIFVPRQVVDEVQRNKVSVTRTSLEELRKKLAKTNRVSLPDIFEEEVDQAARTWNTARDAVTASEEQLRDDFDQYARNLLDKVQRSEDHVSEVLAQVFFDPQEPTGEELERARLRRERGNPPGKATTNPLGDQLSWEQLLDAIEGNASVWIVTGDGDYRSEFAGATFLNAFLQAELVEKLAEGATIHVYSKVADALPAYRDAEYAGLQLPDEEQLAAIRRFDEEVRVSDYVRVEVKRVASQTTVSGSVMVPADTCYPDAYGAGLDFNPSGSNNPTQAGLNYGTLNPDDGADHPTQAGLCYGVPKPGDGTDNGD